MIIHLKPLIGTLGAIWYVSIIQVDFLLMESMAPQHRDEYLSLRRTRLVGATVYLPREQKEVFPSDDRLCACAKIFLL